MHSVSSQSILFALVSGKNIHKSLILCIMFVTNEIFKILFAKRELMSYYYFMNIYSVYRN